MASRLELHEEFCTLLGSRNVYFQPPESVKMKYPAIIYKYQGVDKVYANDGTYIISPCYEVILIDHDSESEYFYELLQWKYCSFDRTYVADNLNHFVFKIFY